jgi:ABC-2 type transport system ATP-binding protein
VIVVNNLSRSFTRYQHAVGWKGSLKNLISPQRETVHAVNDISFSIDAGEFVGYIGPNGAGKSTTIKMLSGILTPTSGNVLINGLRPTEQRKKHTMNIGAIFGQRSQLWWDLTIADSYLLFKHMYKISDRDYQERIESLKELLGMQEFWGTPVRQLSLGQRMRGELGGALLHNPKILFLDEPTIGMDAAVKQQIKNHLRALNKKQNITVLLTTHDLQDIEDLCSRVILINKGKIFYDGSIEEMRKIAAAATLMTIDFEHSIREAALPDSSYCEVNQRSDKRLTVTFQRNEVAPVDLLSLYSSIGKIIDISIKEPPIEDIVQNFY